MLSIFMTNIEGIAFVVRYEDKRINYMKNDGSFISDEWFVEGEPFFTNGFVKVMFDNGVQYYMKYNGIFHTEKPS